MSVAVITDYNLLDAAMDTAPSSGSLPRLVKSRSTTCIDGRTTTRSSIHHANSTTSNAQFTLKISTAMLKKLNSCSRDNPLRLKSTQGGLRLFSQGGFCEVFKAAAALFVDSPSVDLIKKIDQQDARSKSYAHVYSLNTVTGSYTLNLYNADSSGLVNGKGTEFFVKTHLPQILNGIAESFPTHQSLLAINKHIADLIHDWRRDFFTGNAPAMGRMFVYTVIREMTIKVCLAAHAT